MALHQLFSLMQCLPGSALPCIAASSTPRATRPRNTEQAARPGAPVPPSRLCDCTGQLRRASGRHRAGGRGLLDAEPHGPRCCAATVPHQASAGALPRCDRQASVHRGHDIEDRLTRGNVAPLCTAAAKCMAVRPTGSGPFRFFRAGCTRGIAACLPQAAECLRGSAGRQVHCCSVGDRRLPAGSRPGRDGGRRDGFGTLFVLCIPARHHLPLSTDAHLKISVGTGARQAQSSFQSSFVSPLGKGSLIDKQTELPVGRRAGGQAGGDSDASQSGSPARNLPRHCRRGAAACAAAVHDSHQVSQLLHDAWY